MRKDILSHVAVTTEREHRLLRTDIEHREEQRLQTARMADKEDLKVAVQEVFKDMIPEIVAQLAAASSKPGPSGGTPDAGEKAEDPKRGKLTILMLKICLADSLGLVPRR